MSNDDDSGIYLIARSTSVNVLRHLLRVLPFAEDMYGPNKIVEGRYEVLFIIPTPNVRLSAVGPITHIT